jgi:hypothetical protein
MLENERKELVANVLNELRKTLSLTHEHHRDLLVLRQLMSELDRTAYGSNLA